MGVVTPFVRGGAQILHGDQVVELRVQLEVQEREEKGEDGEGQIEVEEERSELKERRTCTVNSRAREAPPMLRRSAFLAWRKRWTRMLSVSCARSFATSLVTGQQDVMAGWLTCLAQSDASAVLVDFDDLL